MPRSDVRRPWALTERPLLRTVTFCALYFAQGVPWGFISIALVAVLSERGATQQQTGALVAVSILPWTFKIAWGPIIDSWRLPALGQRRPWIVFAQCMMATTLLVAFSAADITAESTLRTLGIVLFLHNCFASLQDVATDAMAIDVLEESERGRVNGLMWGSKLLGVSAGGAGMATVMAHWSLASGMRGMAALILVIMLLPLLLVERPGDRRFPWSRPDGERPPDAPPHHRTGPLRVIRDLVRAYGTRATALGLVVAYVAFIGEGLSIPVFAELFTGPIGWTAERYAQAQAVFGTTGMLLGAIGGGFLADRLGQRRMAGIGAAITAATFLAFAAVAPWWTTGTLPLPVFFLMLQTGLALTSVSLFALFMRISWTAAAATQFTLYMTVLNLGNATGPLLTRFGLEHQPTFLLCGGLCALPLLVLPLLVPKARAAPAIVVGGPAEDEPTAAL